MQMLALDVNKFVIVRQEHGINVPC